MNCCILGAGAWGTAMALHLDRCGHAVTLVPRRMEAALALASKRENTDYLPGIQLPHRIQIGHELAPVLMEAEAVFLACPSHAIRGLCEAIHQAIEGAWQLRLFVVMAKGIELSTFKTPAEIVQEVLPDYSCAALSGPTYAAEVAAGQPTAVTFALPTAQAAHYQHALSNPSMRLYLSDDVRGVELAATLKNIYAIAAGFCDGLQLGDNAKAALLTRSLNEMVRLGTALGGQAATFYGLSGFGDLVATCSGDWSRNRRFGQALASGTSASELLSQQKTVVEGYRACESMHALCQKQAIQAPILGQIHEVLYQQKSAQDALTSLMLRDLKVEMGATV